jgi:hypothetical protein
LVAVWKIIPATGTKKDPSLKFASISCSPRSGLFVRIVGTLTKTNKTLVYIMQFYNVRFLGSLAAFVLLGVNAGQAQTSDSMSANVGGSIPANVAGGFAEFTPTINLSSLETAANGGQSHSRAAFPIPPIAGHPVVINPQSPGFFNQQQSLFLPIDPQSQTGKNRQFRTFRRSLCLVSAGWAIY